MRLAVIGSGSLGSLFAAYLSSQVDLILLGHWPAQMAQLRNSGLTMIHIDGRHSHHKFSVSQDSKSIPPVDIVLILVKSYQTIKAAKDAKSLLSPEGLVITLQNGLGNKEKLTKSLRSKQIAQGVTSLGANMVEPGIVRHAGKGKVFVGESASNRSLIDQFAKFVNASGLETEIVENVDGLIWGKLAVNAGINPLTALLRVPNGFLAENDLARSLMYNAAEETAAVAKSLDIELPYPSAGRRAIEVARHTAQNHSSMLQDILRNAQTEIDAICGEVVRHGQRADIPTPINEEFLRLFSRHSDTNSANNLSSKIDSLDKLLSQHRQSVAKVTNK